MARAVAELDAGAQFGSTVESAGRPRSGRKKVFIRNRNEPELYSVTSGRIWMPESEFSMGFPVTAGTSVATGDAGAEAVGAAVSARAGEARARTSPSPSWRRIASRPGRPSRPARRSTKRTW